MDNIQLPFLKANSIVKVELGSLIIQQLQQVLITVSGGKEGIDALKDKINNKQDLTDTDKAVVTLSTLIQEIFICAKNADQIEYKDATEFIGKSLQ